MIREIYFCFISQVYRNPLHKQGGKEETDDMCLQEVITWVQKNGIKGSYRFQWSPCSPPVTVWRSKNTYTGRSVGRFLRVCSSLVAQEDLENTASACPPHHKQTVPHSWHNPCHFHSSGAEPESGIWHPIFWRAQPVRRETVTVKTKATFSLQK